jgi:hypothetical protein
MMPDRDMLMGTSEVVWGITTLPNAGSTFTINFGDGTSVGPSAVTDRSLIAANHTYNASGTFTATLSVTNGATTEQATVTLNVYNPALLSPFDLRNVNVNRTIQNGLRYLWTAQTNRTTFDTTTATAWGNFPVPFTALVVQAFENHGYRLPNSNAAPTGIYPKYVVRRGLNHVLSNLSVINIGATPQGDDPCINVPAPVCQAFSAQTTGDPGYENAIAILPIAGSGALARTASEVTGANAATINGKTLGEILQRMVNATIWGQNDGPGTCCARGGWIYQFNSFGSDGSTNGWDLLALFDASGAGATVPQWVKNEFGNFALPNGLNNDGSFDYQADGNRASNNAVNVAKTGVGIQGMFFVGRLGTDPDLQNALKWISDRWNVTTSTPGGTLGQDFVCSNGTFNKGCAYGMFNVFKGLKLYNVQTLPGVARAAGPGTIPANDWYADYVDFLVANQTNPTTPTGGNWAGAGQLNLNFSSQTNNDPAEAALALLILSPVALVLPDPTTFSSVGLQHGNPLTTAMVTNPVTNPAGTHTVTAITTAANGNPIAGVTVTFNVISGPNAGATGSANTGANGQATFTYTDNGGAGDDQIRASVGNLQSNILVKRWQVVGVVNRCDANGDNAVTNADLQIIAKANGQAAIGLNDPRDGNGDGKINVADVRFCQLRLGQTFGGAQ